jgi:hypothetical protein
VADNVIARKSGNWQAASVLPDVSKTPMGGVMLPVPYPVTSPFAQSQGSLGTVIANKNPVWGFDPTKVPVTQGDEAGTGTGVKSGTVAKDTWPQEKSSTVKAEKTEVIRHDDKVEMNGDKLSAEEEEKAKRQKCRQEQVQAGMQSPNSAVRDAATRFQRNIDAAEHARLSQAVYNPVGQGVPAGWRDISGDPAALARYNLAPGDLQIPGTPFRAGVYEPSAAVFGDRLQTTVAFRGTSGGADWSNNLRQGLNLHSPYYQRAVGLSNTLRRQNVFYTGHSLGGGLASAASQGGGKFATTFNAAGLHSRTVPGYGVVRGMPGYVKAFRIRGELLTAAQEGSLVGAGIAGRVGGLWGLAGYGGATWLTPDAIGNKFDLDGWGDPYSKHGMDQVIQGIEQQKTQDQQLIAQQTGKEC